MIIGMIQSQSVHLNGFGVYVKSRAQVAQSHQRRFRRWLSNRRVDLVAAHHVLIKQALSEWSSEQLYLIRALLNQGMNLKGTGTSLNLR